MASLPRVPLDLFDPFLPAILHQKSGEMFGIDTYILLYLRHIHVVNSQVIVVITERLPII